MFRSNIFRVAFCLLLFIFAEVAAAQSFIVNHRLEHVIGNRNYAELSRIVKSDRKQIIKEIISRTHNSEEQLVNFFEILVNHTNWTQDTQLLLIVDKLIRRLSISKLPPHLQEKFTEIARDVHRSNQTNATAARMMGVDYSPEILGVPKSVISRSRHNRKKIVHIYRHALIKKYEAWRADPSKMDFSSYLKRSGVSKERRYFRKNVVQYLTPEQAKKYLVTFENGRVIQGGAIINDGLYMFVLNMEGIKLFVGEKVKGHFHHSSFVSGEPVQAAGKFYIEHGVIMFVEMCSGHYHPSMQDGEKLRLYLSDPSRLGDAATRLQIESYK